MKKFYMALIACMIFFTACEENKVSEKDKENKNKSKGMRR